MRFPDLYGNESLKSRLSAALLRGGLSHCYIIEGPAGSGKKTLARLLCAAMECEGQGEKPCGTCSACHKNFGGGHPDVIWVDSDKATVPIAVIRQMVADAYILPNEGKRKIYVIPRGQDLREDSQNTLLKLIEEPPEYCAFLILTDNVKKLLPTVRSRAVTLKMSPLSRETLFSALKNRAPNADADALASAMEKCGGYLGSALDLLEAPETALDRQTAEFLRAFATGNELALLEVIAPLDKSTRQNTLDLMQSLYRCFTEAIHPQSVSSGELRLLRESCSSQQLYTAAKAVAHAITLLQANGSSGHASAVLMAELHP